MAERALAHVEVINNIAPIEKADKIEVATVLGWRVVVKKDEFKVGDKVIYIEIDSKVPELPAFEFLRDRKFKVKTIKLRGQLSQGLIVPLSLIGRDAKIGEDVTKELGVTYASAEDEARKAPSVDKYRKMAQRNGKLFKHYPFKWLMRRDWGKKLLFIFFGRKRDKRTGWPSWVTKTDEIRCQNIPWIVENKDPWVATEKIDGTSATYTLRKRPFGRYDFYVCSRNVVFDKPDKKCFYENNVYWEIAERYHIEEALKYLLKVHHCDWVTLQGEIYGAGIQKRDYSMTGIDFAGFNLIMSDMGREDSNTSKEIAESLGIPWVPILDTHCFLPDTLDELLKMADGNSVVDGKPREGIVFRSKGGKQSFKAVSNSFLLKYHG